MPDAVTTSYALSQGRVQLYAVPGPYAEALVLAVSPEQAVLLLTAGGTGGGWGPVSQVEVVEMPHPIGVVRVWQE